LKNSVFDQLSAFHRNTVPLAHYSDNVVCQRSAHKALVLNSGGVFPAGELFNRIGPLLPFMSNAANGWNEPNVTDFATAEFCKRSGAGHSRRVEVHSGDFPEQVTQQRMAKSRLQLAGLWT